MNAYKERMANNIPKEEILKSLRAKARDNARTPNAVELVMYMLALARLNHGIE